MFVAGLVLLIGGGEALVRGASRLALSLGMTPLVVGLTVVAMGTSAPELAVSTSAALTGSGEMAIGNVVGSNIFNILVVLGASALIVPLVVSRRLVTWDAPIFLASASGLLLLAWDGRLDRVDGLLLILGLGTYWGLVFWLQRHDRDDVHEGGGSSATSETDVVGPAEGLRDLVAARRQRRSVARQAGSGGAAADASSVGPLAPFPRGSAHGSEAATVIGGRAAGTAGAEDAAGSRTNRALWRNGLLIVSGLALLTVGGNRLVTAAETIALGLGLSETIVGLTIVAVGTSLPEAVTSFVAAARGQRDMAVGNAVGSSILNILMVLGVVSIVSAEPVPVARAVVTFDLPLMIAVAAACLPILFTGHVIARWEGGLFLAYYGAYAAYLFLDATEHDALPVFSRAMVAFVAPITAVTLMLLTWRARSGARRQEGGGS